MKKTFIAFCFSLAVMFFYLPVKAQTSPVSSEIPAAADPWKAGELLDPAALAGLIKAGNAPLIFNIGAVEDIKTAKHVGPAKEAENLEKFKGMIAALPKTAEVVIYCGCCALPKCPNVRPAYRALKAAGFTSIRVLNLPVNLKTNWIDAGYPLAAK